MLLWTLRVLPLISAILVIRKQTGTLLPLRLRLAPTGSFLKQVPTARQAALLSAVPSLRSVFQGLGTPPQLAAQRCLADTNDTTFPVIV